MPAQGKPMTNYRDKTDYQRIDPRQMSFQGIIDDANDSILRESNKRVADMARGLAVKLADREETLLFHTLTVEQLRTLAQKVHMEMERRGLV